jgi:DNA invertase Pin-like site-specific DNA recombinase
MSVGVYLRVSTLDQENGIASQEKAIADYLASHGITDAKFYRDRLSGKDLNRPAFERMQRDIFCGRVRTVIVWKLDRLSRSLRDGVNVLADWLEKNVRVVAVSQQLDFNGATGQLIASVLFAVAQMERETLRENTKRGIAAAKARGVKLGKRPGAWTREVPLLAAQGMSVLQISKRLGKSRQACYDALARERDNASNTVA